MPADKKKSGSGEGSKLKPPPPKLHATAKEFVPSGGTLTASASAWKPGSKDASKKPADGGKAAPEKNGAKPSAAEAVKQAPKVKAAPAPAKPAWGSKPSDAVKKAGPAKPQQQRQKSAGQRQNQQHNHGRDGRDGGRDDGRRGGDNRGGRRNDQGGGGGGKGGGSWARAASKPSGGGNDGGGGHRGSNRQSQHRGGDRGGGGDDKSNWSRGKAVPKELMNAGEGETDAEKAVTRIDLDDLLGMRLKFLDPPTSWEADDGATKPPPACLWDAPTRIADITSAAAADRIGGDVSLKEKKKGGKPNPNDTAPALEDCKPLEVNNTTRWKAKVMDDSKEEPAEDVESKEDIIRKAMVILNKLSLTTFDKLSDKFIACGIGRDVETLTGAVGLIVNYAQEQQHFSSMYAGLCLKLANTPMEGIDEGSKKGKKFKKILLERCQMEFETDTATKIKEATKGITDKDEIEYHANLIKKHYLGHMRFIGELYKGDIISIKIMLFCLPELLHGDTKDTWNDVDEEKVECFSKLMTVIGYSLEKQSEAMKSVGKATAADSLSGCWKTVEIMAGKRKEEGPKVSNRMKYMLQDLLEMKAKGWVSRRKEETAKTIAEIHKEVEKEERASARKSSSSANLRGMSKGSIRRGASSGDVRRLDKAQSKPQVDKDGFVSVDTTGKGFNRSASMTSMKRSSSEGVMKKYTTRGSVTMGKPEGGGRRPSQGKFAALNDSESRRSSKKGSSNKLSEKAAETMEKVEEKPKVNYLSPDECGDKAKNVLKEFFVGGDADDAVLSIHELVGAGDDGSVDRGAKVVEAAVLAVLEMKQEHVDKFLGVYLRCAKEKKLEGDSFIAGLNDPLEFLMDVAIDAPLAIPILASIVAGLVKEEIIPFNFLLNSPEYFRTDQNAADFGAKVMKNIGGDAPTSEDYIEVIEKLMTCEDKAKHSSAKDLIAEA